MGIGVQRRRRSVNSAAGNRTHAARAQAPVHCRLQRTSHRRRHGDGGIHIRVAGVDAVHTGCGQGDRIGLHALGERRARTAPGGGVLGLKAECSGGVVCDRYTHRRLVIADVGGGQGCPIEGHCRPRQQARARQGHRLAAAGQQLCRRRRADRRHGIDQRKRIRARQRRQVRQPNRDRHGRVRGHDLWRRVGCVVLVRLPTGRERSSALQGPRSR